MICVYVTDDEISGISISIRERDDILHIWNTKALLHEKATVIDKVKELLPDINFSAIFYKGEIFCSTRFILQLLYVT